jgi:hypothetical protein
MELVGLGAKSGAQQIGFLQGDAEQVGFPGRLVMRGGGLEQVPGVVEFMT